MGFRTATCVASGGFDDALGTGTFAMGGDDLAAFYDVITAGLAGLRAGGDRAAPAPP